MTSAEIIRRGIRLVLADMNISQRKAALRAGIHPNQINKFVNGKDSTTASLDKFCNNGLGRTLLEVMQVGSK